MDVSLVTVANLLGMPSKVAEKKDPAKPETDTLRLVTVVYTSDSYESFVGVCVSLASRNSDETLIDERRANHDFKVISLACFCC